MKILRIILGTLLAFIALNAFGGGYYGMAGAENVPIEWLSRSPFKSYYLPSLFLFVIIGGSCMMASIAVYLKSKFARKLSFLSAFLLLSWIGVQVAIIGYVSWMQPAVCIAAIVIIILTRFLPKQHSS